MIRNYQESVIIIYQKKLSMEIKWIFISDKSDFHHYSDMLTAATGTSM